jgi:TRAP-type C4-dicarboxylate transport system permease small subunit
MLTTMTLVVGGVLSVCILVAALWHSAQPVKSVTQILSELETPSKR